MSSQTKEFLQAMLLSGIGGALVTSILLIAFHQKPAPQLPISTGPITMYYLDDMIVWQQGTGDKAVGFSILTDPDDLSWTCYVDKPKHIARCTRSIKPPSIPEEHVDPDIPEGHAGWYR